MCDKVKTALEVIKTQKNKSLTKGEIVILFQQVVSDLSKQGEKMTNLEKEVSALKDEMRAGFADIKKLIEDSKRLTLFEKIMALSTHKYFWITLIIVLLIVGGVLGVSPSGFNNIVTLGG